MLQRVSDPLLDRLRAVHARPKGRPHPNSVAALARANERRRASPRALALPERGPEIVRALFEEINRQKISGRELERRSGFDRDTLKTWRQRCNPRLTTIIAIAEALGFDVVLQKRVGDATIGPRELAIVEDVAKQTNISAETILGRSQTLPVVAARNEVMRRMYGELGLSSLRIGKIFKRDHAGILRGIRRAKRAAA